MNDKLILEKNNKQILSKTIRSLKLSNNIKTSLANMNIENIGDLIQYKKEDFLSNRNFGKSNLRELISILDSHDLKLNTPTTDSENNISKKRNIANNFEKDNQLEMILAEEIKEIEFSERTKNVLLNENIKYLGDLVQKNKNYLLRSQNFGRKSLIEVNNYLLKKKLSFEMNIDWPPANFSEIKKIKKKLNLKHIDTSDFSLINILKENLDSRAFNVLQDRFWKGKTLEEIGKNYNVTRERIRQIETKALRKLKNFFKLHFEKFLEESKNKIFLKYSASNFVITNKSFNKINSKIKYPLSESDGLLSLSIEIIYKKIHIFFDHKFERVLGGWYRGLNIEKVKEGIEEIRYHLDKKPLPKQCETLRLECNLDEDLFKDCSILLDSAGLNYYLIENYFCSNSKSFGIHSNYYLTQIHEIAFKKSPNKFIELNDLFQLVKSNHRLKKTAWANNQSRMRDVIRGKGYIKTEHLFIISGGLVMPIGNYKNYFENYNKQYGNLSKEIESDEISVFQEMTNLVTNILAERKILSINELSKVYVTKLTKSKITAKQSIRIIKIILTNHEHFVNLAPSIWSLKDINLSGREIAMYHIRYKDEYAVDMYSLFRKGGEKINAYKGWSYDFEKYLCIHGEEVFSKKTFESLISISKPEKWNANSLIIDEYLSKKLNSMFLLNINILGSLSLTKDKNKITKYKIDNVARTILYLDNSDIINSVTLNRFLEVPIYYNTAHYYLAILSFANIINPPLDNLESYEPNKEIITNLKDIIIHELTTFGFVSWNRKFGKKITKLIIENYDEFIKKDNWIISNLKSHNKI